jgi:hypothetical protein
MLDDMTSGDWVVAGFFVMAAFSFVLLPVLIARLSKLDARNQSGDALPPIEAKEAREQPDFINMPTPHAVAPRQPDQSPQSPTMRQRAAAAFVAIRLRYLAMRESQPWLKQLDSLARSFRFWQVAFGVIALGLLAYIAWRLSPTDSAF